MIWRCFVRGDQMDRNVLEHMALGGCVEIGLGVESGSQATLNAIDKDETVEQQADCIRWAHTAGIRVKAFLIVGLPGESYATLAETERFLRETKPDDIDVSLLQIYPGAPLHEDPRGLIIEGGSGWYKGRPGEYCANHRTAALSAEELVAARDYLEATYKAVPV